MEFFMDVLRFISTHWTNFFSKNQYFDNISRIKVLSSIWFRAAVLILAQPKWFNKVWIKGYGEHLLDQSQHMLLF